MRQLQFHEYWSLLEGGTSPDSVSDDIRNASLHEAQILWPQLRILPWESRERRIEYVARSDATDKLLLHVSADWDNCFLILVLPRGQSRPESYILFDIGAEYQEPRFCCHAFDVEDVPTEEMIRYYLPQLHELDADPYAILDIGDGTYMQCYAEDGLFDLEHQLVSTASHYCANRRVDTESAVNAFLSYAFGKKEWAFELQWRKMEL